MMLRPSDVDQIITHSLVWVIRHPDHPRSYDICDEIARASKTMILQFMQEAGRL
ncbi:hypothetical protein [Streptosporangium sp. NPDC000509]|uniref:hypothetical protein n=1 Tax=Streptosporangium sp. NPDC000509 TaxID=3366186 RepID=UPI0036767CEC